MTKSRKKLVFVLPEYDVNASTHFNYLIELLEDIAEKMDVCVFVEYGTKPKFKKIQGCYVQKFQIKGLNLIERFFVFLLLRFRGYRRFYVHYSYFSAILAGFVCRFTGAKSFVWYCEQKNLYKKNCLTFRLAIRMIQKVVTCTKLMAGYYHEVFKVSKNKLSVMHNWISVPKTLPVRVSHERKTVLFVHWLSPRKGSEYLPDIVNATLAKIDCDFVIIGNGPDFRHLKEAFKAESRVKMLGAVPNHQAISYYKRADVFIMPSREEEFGRVLIEAMAAGTPIVAMETLGTEAVLNNEQKKFVVKQGDIDDFSDKIVSLLKNSDLRNDISRIGFEHVKHFDKKLSVEKFLEIVL